MGKIFGWSRPNTKCDRFDNFFFMCGYRTRLGYNKYGVASFCPIVVMGERNND